MGSWRAIDHGGTGRDGTGWGGTGRDRLGPDETGPGGRIATAYAHVHAHKGLDEHKRLGDHKRLRGRPTSADEQSAIAREGCSRPHIPASKFESSTVQPFHCNFRMHVELWNGCRNQAGLGGTKSPAASARNRSRNVVMRSTRGTPETTRST